MNALKVGLCEGRHIIQEVEEYIFPQIVPATQPGLLEREATRSLERLLQNTSTSTPVTLNIYVTGLTVALIAAINAAKLNNKIGEINLYHFDRERNVYFRQEVR